MEKSKGWILAGAAIALFLGWVGAVAQETPSSGSSKRMPLVPSEMQIYLNARFRCERI